MRLGITNLKGGVGKTTLSINLAVCFAHMGYNVCIVDTDTNQNSLAWYAVREETLKPVSVVGATEPKALNKVVDQVHRSFDIVIIDGTPNLSEMNTRVILASDVLIIPTRPGAHDFRAMRQFMDHVDHVKHLLAKGLNAFFLINEYDERYLLHSTVKTSLAEYEVPILKSTLKSRTAYGESNLSGSGAYESSDLKAIDELTRLTNELILIATEHHFLN